MLILHGENGKRTVCPTEFLPLNNIALGYKAGYDLTTEKFQLCIKLEGFDEMRTTMTQEEYEVMAGLVKRLFGKAQEKCTK